MFLLRFRSLLGTFRSSLAKLVNTRHLCTMLKSFKVSIFFDSIAVEKHKTRSNLSTVMRNASSILIVAHKVKTLLSVSGIPGHIAHSRLR